MEKTVITSAFLVWLAAWIGAHLSIRRRRAYTHGRQLTATNPAYRILSVLMTLQNPMCVVTIWFDSPWLLKVAAGSTWQWTGLALIYGATGLYFTALCHLGKNYSPCYDSHRPSELILTGPYRKIRHPMYAAKIVLALGILCLSGSLWFIPSALYLSIVSVRSAISEDRSLARHFPSYTGYRKRSSLLFPGL